jgi:hypothetical protein
MSSKRRGEKSKRRRKSASAKAGEKHGVNEAAAAWDDGEKEKQRKWRKRMAAAGK